MTLRNSEESEDSSRTLRLYLHILMRVFIKKESETGFHAATKVQFTKKLKIICL